jgi:hypothetical protein
MTQAVDRPCAERETETCAKATLRSIARTGFLLMGGALASVLLVDLPVPAGRAADGQGATQSHVPASDKWIALGQSSRAEAPRPNLPDLQPQFEHGFLHEASLHEASGIDPVVAPYHRNGPKRARHKSRPVKLASRGRRDVPSAASGSSRTAASGSRISWGRVLGPAQPHFAWRAERGGRHGQIDVPQPCAQRRGRQGAPVASPAEHGQRPEAPRQRRFPLRHRAAPRLVTPKYPAPDARIDALAPSCQSNVANEREELQQPPVSSCTDFATFASHSVRKEGKPGDRPVDFAFQPFALDRRRTLSIQLSVESFHRRILIKCVQGCRRG